MNVREAVEVMIDAGVKSLMIDKGMILFTGEGGQRSWLTENELITAALKVKARRIPATIALSRTEAE